MVETFVFRLADLNHQGPSTHVLLLGQPDGSLRSVAIDELRYDSNLMSFRGLTEDGTTVVIFSSEAPFQVYPRSWVTSLTQGELMEEQFAQAHATKMYQDRVRRLTGDGH